ncbi:MAG: cation-translocating P-type ATPase [Bacteroidia bacterium]|nr:cation-translocating P-type ATPase [Bacteroidia bacterium]
MKQVELAVKGMTCTNCALGIQKYLEKEGMESVMVNFAEESVIFETNEEESVPALIDGIERLGYKVMGEESVEKKGFSDIERYFLFCLIFTTPLLLHMFVSWHILHNPWVQLGLTFPVFVVGMYHFGLSGFRSLRTGVPNMDVLITLGAAAAFFYSLYGTLMNLGNDFLFYETSASIITIVLLGNVMEHRAVKKTTSAIEALVRLQPEKARKVIFEKGQEVMVMVDAGLIRPGDQLAIHAGDRIPVDGEILAGTGETDESMLTGESLPVFKSPGDPVMSGSVLVSGPVRMAATEVGPKTVLNRMIDLVRKAQAEKPEIQQLADKISAVFVPVVLCIAALTFLLAYGVFDVSIQAAIIQSVAVLVISCPCAMGLATPTAVIVGVGRASRKGILVKGGRTLAAFHEVKRIVFDKTGTLTTGAFSIKSLNCEEENRENVEKILAGIERNSTHPIARSLVKALAGVKPLFMREVTEQKGLGMAATDRQGNQYQLGSFRIATGLTNDLSHDLYLIENGKLLASVDLADEIRPGAAELIQFLHEKGVETVLVSGDKKEKCQQVADLLGIKNIYSEQLPEAKLALIEKFSREKPTAMVGDGINDAPALARATVGVSLGKATAAAIQSAQIVLLGDHLTLIEELYRTSQLTVKTIRQNLFWAFFYNVLAIPLAATGFLSPIIGAFTMAMSDVVVIGNSLRLRVRP